MPDTTAAGTPIPPGSTEQEILDIENHELPPLPKMNPDLADAPPQEQDQTSYGTTGVPKTAREPEPALPFEEPHPLKPPIPLQAPAGHSLAVEEEPADPPARSVPNPADAPENFAESPAPEPIPNQMARAAYEAATGGEVRKPVSGPYSAPGPYPQGPTNKGIHGQPASEETEEAAPPVDEEDRRYD